MAELSRYWSGIITGDAGPYSDDTFSDIWRKLFQLDRTVDGVIQNYNNKLVVSGAVSPVTIATGAALVDGKFYESDSAVAVVIPTPVVASRYDVIVVRKSWANQTVRITRVAGAEGGGVPAITQTDGTTWDMPLATVFITTLGAITVTDRRLWCTTPLEDIHLVCNGRLTLTSGTPLTTADVTAATVVYFTPYKGNKIALHDGTNWRVYDFIERSLSIAGYTANKPFDIWIYNNAGVLTLESTEWTNTTTRATAITTQDGIYVKSGATTRRYLGTICTTSTIGQTEDSKDRRFVWNYYNRALRFSECHDTTNTWTYSTATWRAANNSTTVGTARIELVIGVAEEMVRAFNYGACAHTGSVATIAVGVGIDSVTVNSAQVYGGVSSSSAHAHSVSAEYNGYPAVGYHYISRLEIAGAVADTTWYGDNSLSYWQTGMTVQHWA